MRVWARFYCNSSVLFIGTSTLYPNPNFKGRGVGKAYVIVNSL